tara:strand:+ start:10941 stop:12236 length:1296 start_codon:yes stop_codon:yes gene_type:complete
MLNISKNCFNNDENFLKKLTGPVFFNFLGSLLGVISTVIISRNFGAEKLGIISLSLQTIAILTTIALLGYRQQIIKNIAIFHNENKSKIASDFLSNAKYLSGFSSLIIVLITIIILNFFTINKIGENQFILFFQIFVFSLLFIVQRKLNTFILISLNYIKKSVLYEGFFNTFFVCFFLIMLILIDIKVDIYILAIVYLFSRFLNYVLSYFEFRKNKFLTTNFHLNINAILKGKIFYLNSIVNVLIINADIVILGILIDFNQVAIYAVCSRIAKILNLLNYVFVSSISPHLATLYFDSKISELKTLIFKYLPFSLLIAILYFVIVSFFSKEILGLWGKDFSEFSIVLVIMMSATCINFTFSPYSSFLTMTGYEKLELKINYTAAVLYISFIIVLTLRFGIIGSSVAFLLKHIIIDLSKVFYSRKLINNHHGN